MQQLEHDLENLEVRNSVTLHLVQLLLVTKFPQQLTKCLLHKSMEQREVCSYYVAS